MQIHPLIQQTGNNVAVLLIGIAIVAFLMKGFFWQYVKVRLSFGKLILVKVRAVNRDYFRVGEIVEGFMIYSTKSGHKRIHIPNNSVFYRSMAVAWIDVDESSNAIQVPDYSVVGGFDAEKYDNLYKRTLYRPAASDNKEKLMLMLIVLTLILAGVAAAISYFGMRNEQQIMAMIQDLASGLVVPK